MTIPSDTTLAHAQAQDKIDPLRRFKPLFHYPTTNKPSSLIYFTGNSLGLQPLATKDIISQELDAWASLGVEGHFKENAPWYTYETALIGPTAKIVGASYEEIAVMNSLSVNLNLMLVSFYRPTKNKYKILIEKGAFPSDYYALEQQVKWHGFDPEKTIIEIEPKPECHLIEKEDIEACVEKHKTHLALILIGGVQYYTGQFFDLEHITKVGQKAGAIVGFDLAHAVGNVPLYLHKWGVDFACWCSYKYLNSGPGSVGGIFVHQKHLKKTNIPRLSGWWGYDSKYRFDMPKSFVPIQGAQGWQMSNHPILSMAAYKASIRLFEQAGMSNLRAKSQKMTLFLFQLLEELPSIQIISPKQLSQVGCQVSICIVGVNGRKIYEALRSNHIIVDWRTPNVIRLAPVPFYNTFEEIYRFYAVLKNQLSEK